MWPDPQFPADLVTFTKEIFNGKLHVLYIVSFLIQYISDQYFILYPLKTSI